MGRSTISTSYITPFKSDGSAPDASTTFGRGAFTLVAGATYYFMLGGQDGEIVSAHCQWDATIVLTSVGLQDGDLPESEATAYSSAAGDWFDENPSTAYVPVTGAGVVATAAVVAAAGGAQGGCFYHLSQTGARRTRVKVVVGATGGAFRLAVWGKE